MHHSIFPSCAMHFFQHCILKCRDVLQRLGRSSLADLSAALGRARSSDSVRQMAPTAPSSFLPFSPQTIAIGHCKWKTTDRSLPLEWNISKFHSGTSFLLSSVMGETCKTKLSSHHKWFHLHLLRERFQIKKINKHKK